MDQELIPRMAFEYVHVVEGEEMKELSREINKLDRKFIFMMLQKYTYSH